MRRHFKSALLLTALVLLGACTPTVQKAEQPLTELTKQQWVHQFNSARLNKLIQTSWSLSPSLNAARARLQAAAARSQISNAALWPGLSASLQGARGKSRNFQGFTTDNQFQLGADISWQADLWNRLELQSRAAQSDTAASAADLKAAQLSLSGEIARNWFASIEAATQVTLAQQRVESFEATLKTIRSRFLSGVGSALDLRLAQENLASAKATLASRQRTADAAIRQLETLTGLPGLAKLKLDESLPGEVSPPPANLPATLLARRPDIQAAEQRLLASSLRFDDAQKNHLPTLRLTGNTGTSSSELKDLLDFDNLIWTIAASLTQNLFDGGRLSAEKLLADANHREVVANYTQTVLNALRETETLLAAEPLLEQQELSTIEAVKQSRAATELALSRYQSGLTEIITLLDTQRRGFNTESNLLSIRLARLQNRINLHLAIGGDFNQNNMNEQGASQ